jgi:hypothetical protein
VPIAPFGGIQLDDNEEQSFLHSILLFADQCQWSTLNCQLSIFLKDTSQANKISPPEGQTTTHRTTGGFGQEFRIEVSVIGSYGDALQPP